MTKQTRSKIGEVVLILVFCVLSVYITLVGTVFVGTPSMLTQSMKTVAQHLTVLRPCMKRNASVEVNLVPIPCSRDERMRVVQMDESPPGDAIRS